MTNAEAYDLVIAVAVGNVEDVAQIAQLLAAGSVSRWDSHVKRPRGSCRNAAPCQPALAQGGISDRPRGTSSTR